MRITTRRVIGVVAVMVAVSVTGAGAQTTQPVNEEPLSLSPPPPSPESAGAAADLANLSLEDLMNIEVTSVSRRRQRVSGAPAAISVITSEDIERSGMNSIPELLRLAPGLDVMRVDANRWAITSRGFNEVYGNKLLVLMDGRTVYTPLFAGVYWEAQDYILEDLDRIEVIRGPGATLWGANAVNGVININSKDASQTQGLLFSGLIGNYDDVAGLRYGGQIDDRTYYRLYGKYRKTDDFETIGGANAHDGWEANRGGFRVDRFSTEQDTLTLQGDVYTIHQGELQTVPTFAPPFTSTVDEDARNGGGNVLARWTHRTSSKSDMSLQVYYDYVRRNEFDLDYTQHTADVDFQHRFPLGDRQEIIWGLGYRHTWDELRPTGFVSADPAERDTHLVSSFIQDDITVIPDRLHVILGTKLEHNAYSGFELQPSARAIYTPDDRSSVWAGISRAVRTPARAEHDIRIAIARGPTGPAPSPLFTSDVVGNDDFKPEELLAYEVGYRIRPRSNLTFDVTGFFNVYDNLRSFETGNPQLELTPPVPHLLIPVTFDNNLYGETYGVEASATWKVSDAWRLQGSYTWLQMQLHTRSGSNDDDTPTLNSEESYEGASPHNQFQVRSYYDLTRSLELNAALFYVDNLPAEDVSAYTRVDVGLTWHREDDLRFTLGVQNLFDNRHPESGDAGGLYRVSSEVPRTVFAQLVYRY